MKNCVFYHFSISRDSRDSREISFPVPTSRYWKKAGKSASLLLSLSYWLLKDLTSSPRFLDDKKCWSLSEKQEKNLPFRSFIPKQFYRLSLLIGCRRETEALKDVTRISFLPKGNTQNIKLEKNFSRIRFYGLPRAWERPLLRNLNNLVLTIFLACS